MPIHYAEVALLYARVCTYPSGACLSNVPHFAWSVGLYIVHYNTLYTSTIVCGEVDVLNWLRLIAVGVVVVDACVCVCVYFYMCIVLRGLLLL